MYPHPDPVWPEPEGHQLCRLCRILEHLRMAITQLDPDSSFLELILRWLRDLVDIVIAVNMYPIEREQWQSP